MNIYYTIDMYVDCTYIVFFYISALAYLFKNISLGSRSLLSAF